MYLFPTLCYQFYIGITRSVKFVFILEKKYDFKLSQKYKINAHGNTNRLLNISFLFTI